MKLKNNSFFFAILIWWVSCSATLSFTIDKWDQGSVFSRLEMVLNNFDYYDLEPTLSELDKNNAQSEIFAEIILIFHSLRVSNTAPDPNLIDFMGENIKNWHTFSSENTSEFNNLVNTIEIFYNLHFSKNTKERKFAAAADLIKTDPRNFLEAWMQCSSVIEATISSFEISRNYDLKYLENFCPPHYGLSHLPILGMTSLSREQILPIEINNSISQDLVKVAEETKNLYAKIEIYGSLINFGSNVRQDDLVLFVSDRFNGIISDLKDVGYTNLYMLKTGLAGDISNRILLDFKNSSRIDSRYNEIKGFFPSSEQFIEQLETDDLLFFAYTLGGKDETLIETAYKRWHKFIAEDKKSWDEIGTWIQGSPLISTYQEFGLNDKNLSFKTYEQIIFIHDEFYKNRLAKFEISKIANGSLKQLGNELNEDIDYLSSELKVDPSIYQIPLRLGEKLLFEGKLDEALKQLELSWERMPSDLKFESTQTPDILVWIMNIYDRQKNYKKATIFAKLIIQAWKNILRKIMTIHLFKALREIIPSNIL